VEAHKVFYDFELARKAYIESGLLEQGNFISRCCLASLKTGVNYLPAMLEYAYQQAADAGHAGSPFVPDEIWDKSCAGFEDQHYKGVL
jgi:hypothetical protein